MTSPSYSLSMIYSKHVYWEEASDGMNRHSAYSRQLGYDILRYLHKLSIMASNYFACDMVFYIGLEKRHKECALSVLWGKCST
jgi:hypothetical protein